MAMLVLGGDGYLGWPLSVKLALRYRDQRTVAVDNFARRGWVQAAGGNSVTPILLATDRIRAFERHTGQSNLEFRQLDITQPDLHDLIKSVQPTHIFHLAQQASAPWSMQNEEQAIATIVNNEVGNMRLLWAIRTHVPHAMLIKMGSFGEYAKCGLTIPEGYFRPFFRGEMAERQVPFPRESDDIYHISKINDSNYISMACRKWFLRVIDVMQSTIFGVHTEEIIQFPDLYTRFDYDAVFGTVANRFIAQTIKHYPMTVYGTGFQRTGLMALEDSLNSMCDMVNHTLEKGEHRVVNHVTERQFCINEIAEVISDIARARGLTPHIHRGIYDPRVENAAEKMRYDIDADYVSQHVSPTPLTSVLQKTFDIIHRYEDRINTSVFPPEIAW